MLWPNNDQFDHFFKIKMTIFGRRKIFTPPPLHPARFFVLIMGGGGVGFSITGPISISGFFPIWVHPC